LDAPTFPAEPSRDVISACQQQTSKPSFVPPSFHKLARSGFLQFDSTQFAILESWSESRKPEPGTCWSPTSQALSPLLCLRGLPSRKSFCLDTSTAISNHWIYLQLLALVNPSNESLLSWRPGGEGWGVLSKHLHQLPRTAAPPACPTQTPSRLRLQQPSAKLVR